MKFQLNCFLTVLILHMTYFSNGQNVSKSALGFTENKGQISDQFMRPRTDVLFSGAQGEMTFHLRKTGISYQFSKTETWREENALRNFFGSASQTRRVADAISVYRLDLEWFGVNEKCNVTHDAAQPGTTSYYLPVCPEGALNVVTYNGIWYRNVYPGIDLHYYSANGNLKYDYIVAPNADYKKIRVKVAGADRITRNRDGSVTLKTEMGDITEAAPVVYQGSNLIQATWVVSGNELSFQIGAHDKSQPLVIDPLVRNWGTYYGGAGADEARSCATDANGDVYLAGRSKSTAAIATSGSFKTTLTGTGFDAFLAKFNSAGVRLWATYYGGLGDDMAYACTTDALGNVYIAGEAGSGSSSGISTIGAHQVSSGGGSDAFIVKFSSAGSRLWASYYGGTGTDIGEGLAVDPATNDVYMSGYTGAAATGTVIASAGAHQTSYGSAFLVKFNPAGVRQWGTYYGNSQWSHANDCTVDGSGNVYMTGTTDAVSGISTSGAHQLTCLGMNDGFLVKFNSSGVRLWGTYYGDISYENIGGVCTDVAGNVYVAGSSGSPSGIATPGAHQTVIGMQYNPDGMIVKFNSAGVRQWGTYFGGSTEDFATSCMIGANGDLYVAGYSNSQNPGVIATPGSFQSVNGGFGDGYLAQFTTAGVRLWATFYGEGNDDIAYACASDPNNNIYVAGRCTTSTNNIFPSQGSHQATYGGAPNDGFLAQFGGCSTPAAPVNATPAGNATVCSGSSATLTASGSGTVTWFTSGTGGAGIGTGNVFVTPALSAGTATYFAENENVCGISPMRTPVSLTVHPVPTVSVAVSKTLVCPYQSFTLTGTGAVTYSWSSGGTTSLVAASTPTTAVFTATGTSLNGCRGMAAVTVSVSKCTDLADIYSDQGSVVVFPVPTNNILHVRAPLNAVIRLFDASGQLVVVRRCDEIPLGMELGALANGLYVLTAQHPAGTEVFRIIKN